MTSRKSRPARLVRRCSNGELFDTVEGGPVTLGFVADLVWLGEHVFIFDETTREDRTEAVLAPVIFSRLRENAGSSRTLEGVALARALMALIDVRAEFERMHDRLAGLERLLQAAGHPNVDAAPTIAGTGAARGTVSSLDVVKRVEPERTG